MLISSKSLPLMKHAGMKLVAAPILLNFSRLHGIETEAPVDAAGSGARFRASRRFQFYENLVRLRTRGVRRRAGVPATSVIAPSAAIRVSRGTAARRPVRTTAGWPVRTAARRAGGTAAGGAEHPTAGWRERTAARRPVRTAAGWPVRTAAGWPVRTTAGRPVRAA